MEAAQSKFVSLLGSISQEEKLPFLQWVKEHYTSMIEPDDRPETKSDRLLSEIVDFLKKRVPKEGLAPGEVVTNMHDVMQSSTLESAVLHTDAFLYPEEEDIDELCESLDIGRWYCSECGSRKTKPLEFISHSSSVGQLKYVYHSLLPELSGKTVLDIGSRLGAVLYVGYLHSAASNLIGVEMNHFFHCLQQEVVGRFKMADRVKLIHDDICNQSDLLGSADVIVMNNVFECFHDNKEQVRIWNKLYQSIRKEGCLVVTKPSIEESLMQLGHVLPIDSWLETLTTAQDTYAQSDDSGLLGELHLYRVKKQLS